jgi:hypothetical protein
MIQRRKDLLKLMNLVVITDFNIVDEALWNEWRRLLGDDESTYEQVAQDNEVFNTILRIFLVMNSYFYAEENEC